MLSPSSSTGFATPRMARGSSSLTTWTMLKSYKTHRQNSRKTSSGSGVLTTYRLVAMALCWSPQGIGTWPPRWYDLRPFSKWDPWMSTMQ